MVMVVLFGFVSNNLGNFKGTGGWLSLHCCAFKPIVKCLLIMVIIVLSGVLTVY